MRNITVSTKATEEDNKFIITSMILNGNEDVSQDDYNVVMQILRFKEALVKSDESDNIFFAYDLSLNL